MRTAPPNYVTAAANLNKSPVVIVVFDGITRRYSSQTFGDISGANDRKFMSFFRFDLVKIKLIQGQTDLGQLVFVVTDKDYDVSDLLIDNDMGGLGVTPHVGFQGLNFADFVTLPEMEIKETNYSIGRDWKFIARDARRLIVDKIFRDVPHDLLNGAMAATGTTITVDSTTGFVDPTNIPSEIADWLTVGVVMSSSELNRYTSLTGTTFVLPGRGGFGGTGNQSHSDNADVDQAYIFWGDEVNGRTDLIKILLHVLLTTEDGTGHLHYDLTRLDAGFSGFGLGLTEAEVDVEGIENEGYKFILVELTAAQTFAAWKAESAITFIERWILKPLGLFMYVNNSGKLTLGNFDYLEVNDEFSAVDSFTSDNSKIKSLKVAYDERVNWIQVDYGLQHLTRQPRQTAQYTFDESVTAYGQTRKPFVLTCPHLFGSVSDGSFEQYLRRWFYFFGQPPGRFKIEVLSEKWLAEPPDLVSISSDKLPELTGSSPGALGWSSKRAMITSQSVEWVSDKPVFLYEGIVWDLFDRLGSMTTIETVLVGDITRTTLSLNTTNSSLLQAEDAYVDLSPTESASVWKITIRITQPNSATLEHNLIDIGVHVQSPAGTDTLSQAKRNVRYYTGNADVFDVEFYFGSTAGNVSADRVKVDWFSLKEVDNAAVGAGEIPTLAFQELSFFTLDETITVV